MTKHIHNKLVKRHCSIEKQMLASKPAPPTRMSSRLGCVQRCMCCDTCCVVATAVAFPSTVLIEAKCYSCAYYAPGATAAVVAAMVKLRWNNSSRPEVAWGGQRASQPNRDGNFPTPAAYPLVSYSQTKGGETVGRPCLTRLAVQKVTPNRAALCKASNHPSRVC